ncbi:glycoside hydrolase family 27 protein [Deinococcus roseus]|uniref:Alpha-galactosidase n=1 Tax=Deinococcus roseus TaxID=392414 RepID=A0ABQ2DGB9_9DEIO|nr:glycoside hydrolase family 27 protein [Deinococcus roseus]GGJ53450.1 alpha-galactosidase [Deinococcus roseus]
MTDLKKKGVALPPPMGWNSWDCYGASVREDEVRGNAEYMAANLLQHGFEYIVVDIQWYEPGAFSSQYRPFVPLQMDAFSRLMPASNRFPSASGGQGFGPLAAYVHSLGLKFGIHIMRGIPRQAVHQNTPILGTHATARDIAHPNSICPWNTDMYGVDASQAGAQEYYNSLFELYASWGVDFVKVDDIAASRLYGYHGAEVELIRKAMDRCGRPMVLSLSPGPADLAQAEHLKKHASMWRMTDDLWDVWDHIEVMFDRCHEWSDHIGPGHWPDADMLPLGHIGIRSVDGGGGNRWCRLSQDEQRTLMTLWCMARSPLMFGGEMRDLDAFTLALLTNSEALKLQSSGIAPRQVWREGDQVAWRSRCEDGSQYLAVFNLSGQSCEVQVPAEVLDGVPPTMREVWTGKAQEGFVFAVPAHGCQLLVF